MVYESKLAWTLSGLRGCQVGPGWPARGGVRLRICSVRWAPGTRRASPAAGAGANIGGAAKVGWGAGDAAKFGGGDAAKFGGGGAGKICGGGGEAHGSRANQS